MATRGARTTFDADRFRREWLAFEAHFVERPAMAVSEADELIDQTLRTQGYPLGDFQKHIAHFRSPLDDLLGPSEQATAA